MTVQNYLQPGDFTGLAQNYSAYRTGYSVPVRSAIIGLLERPAATLDAVDVGAGTGIWTRSLADAGFHSVTAVEPNDDMRQTGMHDSAGYEIDWRAGTGAATGLGSASADLVCMASSFHWVDFDDGMAEFHRILRPSGWFVALWSTRLLQLNPLLLEIEDELARLQPGLRRSAFGPAGRTEGLTDRLAAHPGFDEVVSLEGRHVTVQSPEHYLGNWRSVNDVRHRLGEEKFMTFLDYVEGRLSDVDAVEVTYATRAWAARRAT
nr:class I SAM-dependent methyltransferase [uncultured Actinoplanes sp.]